MTTTYYQHLGHLGGGIFDLGNGPEVHACAGCGTFCTVPAVHARLCDHQAGGFTHQPDACPHEGWLWLVEVTLVDGTDLIQSPKQLRCAGCGLSIDEHKQQQAADTAKRQVP
jgi:hypothetical protein